MIITTIANCGGDECGGFFSRCVNAAGKRTFGSFLLLCADACEQIHVEKVRLSLKRAAAFTTILLNTCRVWVNFDTMHTFTHQDESLMTKSNQNQNINSRFLSKPSLIPQVPAGPSRSPQVPAVPSRSHCVPAGPSKSQQVPAGHLRSDKTDKLSLKKKLHAFTSGIDDLPSHPRCFMFFSTTEQCDPSSSLGIQFPAETPLEVVFLVWEAADRCLDSARACAAVSAG
ncbi:unnamed protein product [Pleuronectes platessa]|uniref:Uncharacterized protein n=1 Tax=Pleuronectes platessa TaxID=8262 RepID=A0A9N7YVW9_PLEPL|nr:unnamed protein product [Pleuronectes platessa]